VVESACIARSHLSRLFDYDKSFFFRAEHPLPLLGTVVGPSHLRHEVPDCQVNVHFKEDRPCGNPLLVLLARRCCSMQLQEMQER
jgi:hypothetical protein